MYISLWKLMYPKEENITVRPEDIADIKDGNEHIHAVKVNDRMVFTLTHEEALTLHSKLGFSIQEVEDKRHGKI